LLVSFRISPLGSRPDFSFRDVRSFDGAARHISHGVGDHQHFSSDQVMRSTASGSSVLDRAMADQSLYGSPRALGTPQTDVSVSFLEVPSIGRRRRIRPARREESAGWIPALTKGIPRLRPQDRIHTHHSTRRFASSQNTIACAPVVNVEQPGSPELTGRSPFEYLGASLARRSSARTRLRNGRSGIARSPWYTSAPRRQAPVRRARRPEPWPEGAALWITSNLP
jgi:hypothetical protein